MISLNDVRRGSFGIHHDMRSDRRTLVEPREKRARVRELGAVAGGAPGLQAADHSQRIEVQPDEERRASRRPQPFFERLPGA